MLYFIPFLTSFILSFLFCLFFLKFLKINFQNREEKRHIHQKKISRLGGMAIIFAFILTLFLDQNLILERNNFIVLGGILAILVFGLLDDFYELNWKIQLFFQILLILSIVRLGIKIEFITNPFGGIFYLNNFLSFVFTILWILVIMNAVNWSDGIDGLAGGIIFLASWTLFFLSLRPDVNQPPLAISSIILAGSVLGFMVFNFPPAKIFAGSSGSFFMGFLVAVLAIFAGAKIGATLLVLVVPLTDSFFVVWQRWKNKQSFFQADNRHLHHHLLQLGWTHKKIAFFYYLITMIGSIIALFTQSISKFLALIIFSGVIFLFCFFSNKLVENK